MSSIVDGIQLKNKHFSVSIYGFIISCYYIDFDTSRKVPNRQNVIYEKISHAMAQLDEFWDKHDLDRGDKMRINKVRADLREIKTILLKQEVS